VFIANPALGTQKQLFTIAEGEEGRSPRLRGGISSPQLVHSFQGLGSAGEDEARERSTGCGRRAGSLKMPSLRKPRGIANRPHRRIRGHHTDWRAQHVRPGPAHQCRQERKPVLYKRHFGAGIEEFLSFAEYMVAEDNKDIILCERGILPLGREKLY